MDELARRANCSNSTIRDFEAHRRMPHKNRLAAIRQALEVAGIGFDGDPLRNRATVSGPVRAVAEEVKKKPLGRGKRSSGSVRKVKARAA
jgi:transcriptional regulator with XRE-family HTH domain